MIFFKAGGTRMKKKKRKNLKGKLKKMAREKKTEK